MENHPPLLQSAKKAPPFSDAVRDTYQVKILTKAVTVPTNLWIYVPAFLVSQLSVWVFR